ncbi:MAG TPA: hypothetical protein VM366_18995 [Anaerolineae bacterium]|nr:hypothetical protein [Anaerolineae bacterium]
MSNSISIHDIDDQTAEWLRREAEQRDTTIQQVALELIRRGIQHLEMPTYDDLNHLAGTWSDRETDEFLSAIADLERVDEGLWQ